METMMREKTITGLQQQIVKALETGNDPGPILKELGELRAKIAQEAELAELQKIAEKRQALRDRAEEVKEKIRLQSEAIDAFLKARDAITTALAPILEQARELPALQAKCSEQYRGSSDLAWATKLPEGYLPKELTIPFVEGKDKISETYDRAAQAVFYIGAGLGLLQSLKREDRPIPEREATEFEAIEPETSEVEPNCRVCNHEKVEEINKALQNGRPLRELETEFDVSRSTLSRHKNNCLSLGAIRIRG